MPISLLANCALNSDYYFCYHCHNHYHYCDHHYHHYCYYHHHYFHHCHYHHSCFRYKVFDFCYSNWLFCSRNGTAILSVDNWLYVNKCHSFEIQVLIWDILYTYSVVSCYSDFSLHSTLCGGGVTRPRLTSELYVYRVSVRDKTSRSLSVMSS